MDPSKIKARAATHAPPTNHKGRAAAPPTLEHVELLDFGFKIPFSTKKNQGSWETCLNPGPGKRKYKLSLG